MREGMRWIREGGAGGAREMGRRAPRAGGAHLRRKSCESGREMDDSRCPGSSGAGVRVSTSLNLTATPFLDSSASSAATCWCLREREQTRTGAFATDGGAGGDGVKASWLPKGWRRHNTRPSHSTHVVSKGAESSRSRAAASADAICWLKAIYGAGETRGRRPICQTAVWRVLPNYRTAGPCSRGEGPFGARQLPLRA